MRRINAVISDDAHAILLAFQKNHNINNKDATLDAILLEFGRLKK